MKGEIRQFYAVSDYCFFSLFEYLTAPPNMNHILGLKVKD